MCVCVCVFCTIPLAHTLDGPGPLPSLEEYRRRIYRPGPCTCNPTVLVAWTGNKGSLLRCEIAIFEPSAAHSTLFEEGLIWPPTYHQVSYYSKVSERWALLYTYSWNLVIPISNVAGSNDGWAFKVSRPHTRFLFFALTKLVLWYLFTRWPISLEAISTERGLCSQILDRRPLRNWSDPYSFDASYFVSVHSSFFFLLCY